MTAQISDIFRHRDERFKCLRFSGGPLFDPQDYGLIPVHIVTACHRGFWCEYEAADSRLRLRNLYIHTYRDSYPDINGVSVTPLIGTDEEGGSDRAKGAKCLGHRCYELALPIAYTGKLLAGRDFDYTYYRHMGFQVPYGYRTLLSFEFEDGELKDCEDFSEIAKMLREIRQREVCAEERMFRSLAGGDPYAQLPAEIREKLWWRAAKQRDASQARE